MKRVDMKKISSIISSSFLILFLLVSNVYCSSEWVELYKNDDGDVLLYNKGSIEKGEGEIYSMYGRKWFVQKKVEKNFSKLRETLEGLLKDWTNSQKMFLYLK